MSDPSSPKTNGSANRLTRRAEFDRVFADGLVHRGRQVVVRMRPSARGSSRLGIVVSRKVGGAVRRNRFKRLVREAFRQTAARLGRSWDVVVVVRPGGSDRLAAIATEMDEAFTRFSK